MAEVKIDEDLYSRQLYVYGHEAQRRMATSDVLIVGLNGLGVEAAKNVILSGVKSVCLHDNTPATWSDLSSNFYIEESDLGKSRAEICTPKLAELNPYVRTSILSGEFTKEKVLPFKVVLLIEVPLALQIEVADFCHANNICVIVSDVYGVFGHMFCDFGESFTCYDTDGQPAAESMIASITNDSQALVTTLETSRHGLQTGDVVTITSVEGIPEINARGTFKVTEKDSFSFEIDMDTTNLGLYVRGGYITQVKQPKTLKFKKMSESLLNHGGLTMDFVKFERGAVHHLSFQAIKQFSAIRGHLPKAGNRDDAESVFQLTVALNEALPAGCEAKLSPETLLGQKKLIYRLSMCCRGIASPVSAVMGGIVGQEVLKACSGKFMPTTQWLYFDALEALSEEPLPEEEVTPMGCRYDGQIMIWGRSIQKRLSELKVFVVGAGAIGCEMMKNFAMMGVSSGDDVPGGMVHITDMDQIEKSNLSRQFLFRNKDINSFKSTTAVRAVKKMNPAFQATSYENKVGPETEQIFNDDFFDSLDFVFTALDNVQARLYVDQKCVFYRKPMLDSGTLGAQCSTQVIVPGVTAHYGATRDPPEKSIPICTLKHFPNLIEHTLAWAKDWFEECFKLMPADACTYLSSAEEFHSALANQQNVKLEALKRIKEALLDMRPRSYHDCIHWARAKFEDNYSNKVKQLLHNFPHDKEVAVEGGNGRTIPFWSGAKKPPTPIDFDPADELHMEFIITVANLRAAAYGISDKLDKADILRALNTIQVDKFVPADGVVIPTTEEDAKSGGGSAGAASSNPSGYVDVDAQCAALLALLPTRESFEESFRLNPFDFEKDDDSHMRVVAACSNLRARNYNIPIVDLHRARGIAGKILPAIATTTALATGTICLEMFKILQNKPIEQLENNFANIAVNFFTHEEPPKPAGNKAIIKGKEWNWTVWDRIEIDDPSMTLQALINFIKEQYGCDLTMLSAGESMLYGDYMDRKKIASRMPMTLVQLTELVTKRVAHESQKFMVLEVLLSDAETGEDVDMPTLRFRLR
jgi:ubiquitin-activating enzyme E1